MEKEKQFRSQQNFCPSSHQRTTPSNFCSKGSQVIAKGGYGLRYRWRQRPMWHLVRWQSGWALLIALPKIAHQVRCIRTLMGIKVDSEFCLLPMKQSGTQWRPVAQLRGQWQINLPLPANWRVSGSPKTVHMQGHKWLLLPVSFGS